MRAASDGGAASQINRPPNRPAQCPAFSSLAHAARRRARSSPPHIARQIGECLTRTDGGKYVAFDAGSSVAQQPMRQCDLFFQGFAVRLPA